MTELHDEHDAPRALVPQLERELVDAARRAPRPAVHGARPRSRGTGVWWRSPLLAAALVVVAFGAAALAAKQLLLNGAPVALPRGIPLQPRSGLGVPLPHSPSAILLQTSDPAGGPAWGARFVATTRGYGCLQFGRVSQGELGVIGQDGSFSDDARFHALPLDYLEGPFPCAPLDARGHAFAGVFMDGTPASGQVVEESCSARGGLTHSRLPVCPAADERLLMAGMAGPLARAVTYADPGGTLHTVSTVGPQGAYLIVEQAPTKLGLEAGEYEPGPPGAGAIRQIAYANAHVCNTRQELGRTARGCPFVGEQPVVEPGVTAASVASPVSVLLRMKAVRMRYQTAVLPMFVISFRARVPVTNGASGYLISVSCGHARQEGPVFANVGRGQLVTRDFAQNGCRGTAHVRVSYQDGGHTDGLPFNLGGRGLTVGTRTIEVTDRRARARPAAVPMP
jgi:hypothetical protein